MALGEQDLMEGNIVHLAPTSRRGKTKELQRSNPRMKLTGVPQWEKKSQFDVDVESKLVVDISSIFVTVMSIRHPFDLDIEPFLTGDDPCMIFLPFLEVCFIS